MPYRPKVIQDRPKSGEKPLGLSRGFEAPHGSLALPRRLMRTLCSIVQTPVLAVLTTGYAFPLCGGGAGQLVRADHPWEVVEALPQCAEEFLGGLFVASTLHQIASPLP